MWARLGLLSYLKKSIVVAFLLPSTCFSIFSEHWLSNLSHIFTPPSAISLILPSQNITTTLTYPDHHHKHHQNDQSSLIKITTPAPPHQHCYMNLPCQHGTHLSAAPVSHLSVVHSLRALCYILHWRWRQVLLAHLSRPRSTQPSQVKLIGQNQPANTTEQTLSATQYTSTFFRCLDFTQHNPHR